MWHLQTGSCGLGFGVYGGYRDEREREKEEIVTVGVRCV